MLLSNIAVAQHIAVHLPEQALLRRHDNPIERRLVRYFPVCFLLSLTSCFYIRRPPSWNGQSDWDISWIHHLPAPS